MSPFLTVFAVLAGEPYVLVNDPPKPTPPAVLVDQPREDFEGKLKALRQTRERLATTHGPYHPDMALLNRAIAFHEAYISLKEKLDQRKAEIRDLEVELKRLLERQGAVTPQSPKSAGSAVEQKLDAIIQRLDQMEKRLANLEKAKQP